ncbi:unnamed protein product, partial [Rotaria sp. Silwood2]
MVGTIVLNNLGIRRCVNSSTRERHNDYSVETHFQINESNANELTNK